jgi:hypothetical protein
MARHTQRHEPNPKAATVTFGVEMECFLPRGSVPVGGYHGGIELGAGSPPAGTERARCAVAVSGRQPLPGKRTGPCGKAVVATTGKALAAQYCG